MSKETPYGLTPLCVSVHPRKFSSLSDRQTVFQPQSRSPLLSSLLHYTCNIADQHLGRWILPINLPISLSDFPSFRDQYSEIRSHAGVYETDVGTYDGDLFDHAVVNEERGSFLFGGEDDSIGGYMGKEGRNVNSMMDGVYVDRVRCVPLIPRLVVPPATAAKACSIWTSFPDGEKVVREKLQCERGVEVIFHSARECAVWKKVSSRVISASTWSGHDERSELGAEELVGGGCSG